MARRAVELMPGDVVLGFAGETLKTLLGSCVTVILTDPRRTVASMCHIVYAGLPSASNADNTAYATVAMDTMFNQLTGIGIAPTQCEAYVYGGGNMFPELAISNHVGDKNADWVLNYLDSQAVPVVEYRLGGTGYRKVSWTVGPAEPLVETVFPD